MAASSGINPVAIKRLTKEATALARSPPEGIVAKPTEGNLFEWHYCITGPKDTHYEGGRYWGLLRFKETYPLSPPSVIMLTPSGRFAPGKKLCLSMSDFHPETWQPAWGVEKVILGLQAFMASDVPTTGAITTSSAEKRRRARRSIPWNLAQPQFCSMFPELLEVMRAQAAETAASASSATSAVTAAAATAPAPATARAGTSAVAGTDGLLDGDASRGAGGSAVAQWLFVAVVIAALLWLLYAAQAADDGMT